MHKLKIKEIIWMERLYMNKKTHNTNHAFDTLLVEG